MNCWIVWDESDTQRQRRDEKIKKKIPEEPNKMCEMKWSEYASVECVRQRWHIAIRVSPEEIYLDRTFIILYACVQSIRFDSLVDIGRCRRFCRFFIFPWQHISDLFIYYCYYYISQVDISNDAYINIFRFWLMSLLPYLLFYVCISHRRVRKCYISEICEWIWKIQEQIKSS